MTMADKVLGLLGVGRIGFCTYCVTYPGPAACAERLNPPRLPLKPSGVFCELGARGHPHGKPFRFPKGTEENE